MLFIEKRFIGVVQVKPAKITQLYLQIQVQYCSVKRSYPNYEPKEPTSGSKRLARNQGHFFRDLSIFGTIQFSLYRIVVTKHPMLCGASCSKFRWQLVPKSHLGCKQLSLPGNKEGTYQRVLFMIICSHAVSLAVSFGSNPG